MALFDEETPRAKPATHQMGQDLGALSLAEIDERVELLEAEIGRLKATRTAKVASAAAADAFFRKEV